MSYTAISFGDLTASLALRLDDPTMQFWTKQELQLFLQDAIRFWNCLCGDARTNYPLTLDPAQVWYDLQTIAGSPREAIITDFDLYTRIQLLLIEGNDPLNLATTQFTAADIASAVQFKRDEFLLRTGITRTIYSPDLIPGTQTLTMPQEVIEAPRAYYLPVTDAGPNPPTPWPLQKIDSYGITGYGSPSDPIDPITFSAGVESPLTVTFYPPPTNPGGVEFITVQSQALLSPIATDPTIINMPSDLAQAIMWGALGYLLSISLEASDKFRSDYANQRFEQFIDMVKNYPWMLSAKVDGIPIYCDAVEVLDSYAPNWRTTKQVPDVIGLSGQNLLAIPSETPRIITLFMTGNAVVPAVDADPVQLGREVQDAILDYAQHCLMFKCQGQEFGATFFMLKSIATLAASRNSLVRSMSFYKQVMTSLAARENQIEFESSRNTESVLQSEAS